MKLKILITREDSMKNIDLMTQFLRSEGFKYEIDIDGDVAFKYQMSTFVYYQNEDDDRFFQLAMPAIFDADEDNLADAFEAANYVSMKIKAVKAIIVRNEVWLMVETLLDSTPLYGDIVPTALHILTCAQREFYDFMNKR